VPELWSEIDSQKDSSGYDMVNDCCFSGCFGTMLVFVCLSLPVLALMYALYMYR